MSLICHQHVLSCKSAPVGSSSMRWSFCPSLDIARGSWVPFVGYYANAFDRQCMLGVCLWNSDQANVGINCAHVTLHFLSCHVTKCQCCAYIGTTLLLLLLEYSLSSFGWTLLMRSSSGLPTLHTTLALCRTGSPVGVLSNSPCLGSRNGTWMQSIASTRIVHFNNAMYRKALPYDTIL